jgi:EmrB/QacA subfamily drug resistance transporter
MEDVPALKQAPEGRPSLHPALELSPRARNEVLVAILLALFLSALDQTIVGTALPRIVTDLSGNDLYTWVVTSYLLTSTITGPIYGKLSDLYGRKPMLLIGISIFLLGSFLSGLSQDMWQLILFRGVQGLGAGAIFPVSLAVIGDLFTPAERGKYQGLFGAVFGVSALVGPWLGGFITDALSWHWVFFINLPIGAVALYVIWRVLPTFRRPDASRSIDYLGVAVFTGAVVPFLVGITNKQTGEWTDPQVGGLMLLGLALGVVFVLIERRAIEPIVDLGLFRMRSYSSSIVATFLASFGFFGAVIFLPRFFQFVRGSSATQSGYQILPLLVGVIFSSILAGQIVARSGRYKVLIVVSLGIAALGLAMWTQLHAGTDIWVLWLWMFVTGLGLGPTLAVFTIIVQASVPVTKLGVATSNLTFFRQIGGSIGLAIVGTVFGDTLRDQAPVQLVNAGVPQQLVDQFAGHSTFSSGSLTAVGGDLGASILAAVPAQVQDMVKPLIPAIVAGIHEAFALAVAAIFAVGAIAMVLALVAALFMKEVPLRASFGSQPAPAVRGESPVPVEVTITD